MSGLCRTKLLDSEEVCGQLRKQLQRSQARLLPSPTTVAVSGVYDVGAEEASVDDVLAQAKRDVECLTRKTKHLSRAQRYPFLSKGRAFPVAW